MDDNVVLVRFDDASKAYQGLSELKQAADAGRVELRSAALLERGPDGAVRVPEGADNVTGLGTASGGLLGMLVGVLGGPIGMLFGGSVGMLTGGTADVARAADQDVALDTLSRQIEPGRTALVAEVGEVAPEGVDTAMAARGGTVTRRSAADVYNEVQSAEAAADAADAEARRVLREQRRAEHKDKWEHFKTKIKAAVS